jgi:hypothetical protein
MSNENQNTLSWEAAEFKHYPKNMGWYVVLIAVTLMVMAFFIIIQSDIFAAVSLGILALLIIFFAGQKPQRVEIELNSKGVRFGNITYPYKQLKYFWVVHNERHRTINFHTSALLNSVLILELESQDPEQAREYLLQYLPEHSETEETPVQKVMHRFKF